MCISEALKHLHVMYHIVPCFQVMSVYASSHSIACAEYRVGQCVLTRSCSHSFASLVSNSIQSEEWYVFQIKRHTRSVAPGGQKRCEPIKLLSCCTGSFAEAAVLQALLAYKFGSAGLLVTVSEY